MRGDGEAELLLQGEIEVLGRLRNSSNETFLVEVATEAERHWAVYKPELGERPLHDFEPGLYRRERAAYLLGEALGWHLVPTTVVREDAPLGVGSLQWFVEHDPTEHVFTLFQDAPETHDDLRRLAVFDLVANNADRKAGHVLREVREVAPHPEDEQRGDGASRLWGIDHGLCLAAPFKLRTVIWDFAREPIAPDLLADVARLADALPPELDELLDPAEVTALRERALRLLARPVLPEDPTGMRFPWPLI